MKKTWRRSFTKGMFPSLAEEAYISRVMERPVRVYDKTRECFIWVPFIKYNEKDRVVTSESVNYNGKEILCIMTHIPTGAPICASRRCGTCPERNTVCRARYDRTGQEYDWRECHSTIWH